VAEGIRIHFVGLLELTIKIGLIRLKMELEGLGAPESEIENLLVS
jgi:hypothetical protein